MRTLNHKTNKTKGEIILGIDPGSVRVGYGAINVNGRKLSLINYGILPIAAKNKRDRLLELESSFISLLRSVNPNSVSMEKLFFCRNAKTAMEVAECRGVLTLIVLKHKIALSEYTPLEVKQSICGYGKADKKTVARFVKELLGGTPIRGHDDASDALAIAITAAFRDKYKVIK